MSRFPNELMGGSELQYFNVQDLVPSNVNLMLNHFITKPGMVNIHWQHQHYDQPSVSPIRDSKVVDKIDAFVFVSNHQRLMFEYVHNIPRERSVVIRNAIWPLDATQKPMDGVLRLIYTSTPFRGLEVLVGAFELILERRPDLKNVLLLDIFSSMKLYGGEHAAIDHEYQSLYDRCMKNANIQYHGAVLNKDLRQYLEQAHIFAYPNTWEETSCIAAIEAMSAGCFPVISNLGALPETCSHFAYYYSPISTDMYQKELVQEHVKQYADELEYCIDQYMNGAPDTMVDMIEQTNKYYSWERRRQEWASFFNNWR